jgi:hypothetical protein
MVEFICHIAEGKITNPHIVRKSFDELGDGSYWVKVIPKKGRSLNQNAYYWACVLEIVLAGLQQIGYREIRTKEDAHEVCKDLFLKRKIANEDTGEILEIRGSTAKISTFEFGEYIERIAQWSAEYLGCVIDPPNTQTNFFYGAKLKNK